MDLDNFKEINDNYGHEAGDQVLCEVARRLANLVRETDTVSRLGGDEFTLLFTGLKQQEDIEPIIRKIQASFQAPIAIKNWQVFANCSLGASFYPDSANYADELLRIADQAMYQNKQSNGAVSR